MIEAAPDNPNVVYAGGQFNYGIGSGGILPLGRRRPDVDQPRVRPASGLPGLRLRSRTTRTRSSTAPTAVSGTASTAAAGSPAQAHRSTRVNWQSLNGTVRPADDRRDRPNRAADRPVHLDRDRPDRPGPLLGRHAGQRHAAQVRCVRLVVRHPERRRRPGARRSDRRRHLRVRRAGPELLRLRHVLRHLAVPDGRRRSVLLQQQRDHERDQPGRSVDLLHPDGDEQEQAEPALPRHVSALSHEQRQDADCRGRPLGPHQPRPDGGLRGDGSERGTRVLPLGNRPRGR